MNIKNINNLVELFFVNYEKQNKNDKFLTSLKDQTNQFTWKETFYSIKKVSSEIQKYVKKGDRCLLISENRPEWFISDLSIMLSNLITVPTYTTYVEKDYEYIIDDSKPSIIIISDQEQFNKIKNIIKKKEFIKKIFSFEELNEINTNEYYCIKKLNFKEKLI